MIIKNGKNIETICKGSQIIGTIYKGALLVYENFKNLIASGVPPLTLLKSGGKNLVDYKLYGNSIQNGTPTPEAPIEVESVGERTKNLWEFDFKEYSVDSKNTTYTFSKPITKECTFFYRTNNYTSDGNVYIIGFIKQNSTTYVYPNHIKNNNIININSSEENPLLSVQVRNAGTGYISGGTIDNFMLVEGTYDSNTMPDYEPYGYRIPVKVSGKNLFNIKNISDNMVTNKFIEFYEDYSGFIMLATAFVNGSSIGKLSVLCPELKVGDTFRISFESNAYRQDRNVNYFYLNKYGNTIFQGRSYVCTQEMLDSGVFAYRGEVENAYIKNIQFELGTTTTSYESYKEPVTTNIYLDEPLRKIGDCADYIDFVKQKVVRSFNKVDLGTLTWYTGRYTAGYYAKISQNAKRYSAIELPNSICDISKVQIWNGTLDTYAFAHTTDMNEVYFKVASIYTLEQWQELTQGHYLIYQLDTEDDTETIELPNISTTKGTCVLSVDTKIKPMYLEAVYKGKGQLQLMLEEDNVILNSILATDTDTQLNITNTEIVEILDEIIGG